MNRDEAFELLDKAGLFYGYDPSYDSEDEKWLAQELNMNDVWFWASAWGEGVSDEELPELARLFSDYGWCGILYWVSQKHNSMRSEFYHYNRMIEFVENEEAIKKDYPNESTRAYKKISYKIKGKRR